MQCHVPVRLSMKIHLVPRVGYVSPYVCSSAAIFSYFNLNSRASSSLGFFVNSCSYASYKAEHVPPVIFSMEKFKSPRGPV